jgi:hypothetical protein
LVDGIDWAGDGIPWGELWPFVVRVTMIGFSAARWNSGAAEVNPEG